MGLILFATAVPIEMLVIPDPQPPHISADMMPQEPRKREPEGVSADLF